MFSGVKQFRVGRWLALSVVVCGLAAPSAAKVKKGDRAAEVSSARDKKNRKFKIKRQRGKVLVVSFGASWCVPCRKELPAWERLSKKYSKKNGTFELEADDIIGPGITEPVVYRTYMPGASPAAFAVALPGGHNYCWDAGECRLRYIWKGDFVDGWAVWRSNGNGLAKIQGDVLLREERNPVPFDILADSAVLTEGGRALADEAFSSCSESCQASTAIPITTGGARSKALSRPVFQTLIDTPWPRHRGSARQRSQGTTPPRFGMRRAFPTPRFAGTRVARRPRGSCGRVGPHGGE